MKLTFLRTHAAAVWYNRLANKTVKDKLDEVDEAVAELNGKLVLDGTLKVFEANGSREYPLVLRGVESEPNDELKYHQLVMRESGGHFGQWLDGKWTTLWEIASKDYVNDIVFAYRGPAGDANTLKGKGCIGMYRLYETSSNVPNNNGLMLVFSNDDGSMTIQIALLYNASELKIRTYWYNAWNDWKGI